jgi:hypothetical protein
MFAYGAAAAFIAGVILTAASALDSKTTLKVGFHMSVKTAEQQVNAGGSALLSDGRFGYEGGRLSFAGTIEGDEVRIEGTVASADQKATRSFKASGRITSDRLSLPLNGSDGRRIGSLKLELPSK